ncbi:hypothetical protein [Burkholderia cepacia]|uniref:hypothetical protein n=1 Tax=Burkholderia cepacia TaxID=292 RepID=UPI000AADA256|nr:hypothetical protein [Burkholderia cepacia]
MTVDIQQKFLKSPLFLLQVRIKPLPTNPQARLLETGVAHGLTFAPASSLAVSIFTRHLREYHWDVLKILLCQETDPEKALGHPPLERLLAVALQHGVAAEVVPAAFSSDPGQAS